MIKQLRYKFILINMVIVTVMLLIIFGMVLTSTSADMEEQSIRTMRFLLEDNSFPMSRPGEPSKSVQLPFFHVTVGHDGTILAVRGGYYDLSDQAGLTEIVTLAVSTGKETGELKNHNLRFCRKQTPYGQALVFVDTSSEVATIKGMIQSCVMIGILSLGIFLVISFLLARWAIRPVEKAWTQQKQFVADASHELKTPLTVIMTTAEILSGEEYDEDQKRQMIGNILTMSSQMRGLVESLLELARVDNGASKQVFSTINLSSLVSDGILPFEPIYFEQGLQLESNIEENIGVNGSITYLKQLIDIFLDNALKYSHPNGCITMTLKRMGNSCLLSVSSPGDAMSKEDLKRIFRRFYRMDKVRAMDHSYGLGLSIAETIVKQHKGKIWAESKEGFNTFFVQLPTI